MGVTQIRISAKNLGVLAVDSFCPRCFWLKLRCKNDLPFQIFPGIFSSIDSYSKKVTTAHFKKYARIPPWFDGFGSLGQPVKTPHHSNFYWVDPATDIKLTGVPDEIFRRPDGSYFIVDYKTARHTDHQNELFPMYEVQLNGYALIAPAWGYDPVSGVGIVYYEPQTELTTDEIDEVLGNDGFTMPFAAKLKAIDLHPQDLVLPLLKRVQQIHDQPRPPKGRDDCRDCIALKQLSTLAGG